MGGAGNGSAGSAVWRFLSLDGDDPGNDRHDCDNPFFHHR
jgi:hypothetical protein